MSFTIFYIEKTPLQPIKKKLKSQKTDIFLKGLTHGFGLKMAAFPTFIFQAIQPRKMSFTIFYIEKTPLQPIKKKLKSQKTDIFLKGLTHSFGTKLAIFQLFFQAIQARKMSFTIFCSKKTPFQAIKTRSSKEGKIEIFAKRLTNAFGLVLVQKLPFFQLFFRQYRPRKCVLRYSRTIKRLSTL